MLLLFVLFGENKSKLLLLLFPSLPPSPPLFDALTLFGEGKSSYELTEEPLDDLLPSSSSSKRQLSSPGEIGFVVEAEETEENDAADEEEEDTDGGDGRRERIEENIKGAALPREMGGGEETPTRAARSSTCNFGPRRT